MDDISTLTVGALVFGALAFGLFKCGQWVGEGRVLLRYIEGEQWKELAKRLPFAASAGYKIRRNARLRIAGSLVVLCIFYLVIAVEFGVIWFLISLPSCGRARVDGRTCANRVLDEADLRGS